MAKHQQEVEEYKNKAVEQEEEITRLKKKVKKLSVEEEDGVLGQMIAESLKKKVAELEEDLKKAKQVVVQSKKVDEFDSYYF